MLANSTTLVMDDVKNSLAKIEDLTVKVESTLAGLSKIQTIINCAAAIVILGGAVMSKNPNSIAGAIEALEEAVS